MTIQGIRRCQRSGQPVLFLRETAGERLVPLGLPPEEARILEAELQGARTRQSYGYTLLSSVLDHLGGDVAAVMLHLGPNGVLESRLKVDGERAPGEIEAHPIDALAMAHRRGSPILLNRETLERKGFVPRVSVQRPLHDEDESVGAAGAGIRAGEELSPALRDFLSSLDLSGLDDR